MKFLIKYIDAEREAQAVNVYHADRVAAEREGAKRGWPQMTETPASYLSLQVYKAARRAKLDNIPETWEDFADLVDDMEVIDDVENPTQ